MMSKKKSRDESTLAALLREKPKRGRPKHAVSRQTVYVALNPAQKQSMEEIPQLLNGDGIKRADIPDMATMLLSVRLEALRKAVSDRDREMPEGITALDSLYLLWDVPLPETVAEPEQFSWTSVRLSPQQLIQLGRANGLLNALFQASRSEVFSLGLGLLDTLIRRDDFSLRTIESLSDFEAEINGIYL